MNQNTALRLETARIAESPRFARCAKLRNLLLFLLKRAGDPARLSQYDVAVLGLGRPSNFDETADTSVRTSMARLRRLLADHYAVEQPQHGLCVYIRAGEYRLRAATLAVAYPLLAERLAAATAYSAPAAAPGEQVVAGVAPVPDTSGPATRMPPVAPAHERSIPRGGVLVLMLLAALLAGGFLFHARLGATGSAASGPLEVPSVRFVAITPDRTGLVDAMEAQARRTLGKSMISRVAPPGRQADYTVTLSRGSVGDATAGASLTLVGADGMTLADTPIRLSGDRARDLVAIDSALHDYIAPIGAIAQDALGRMGDAPRNDFECFLWTENGRATGADAPRLIDQCLQLWPKGRFSFYLRARQLFHRMQQRVAAEGALSARSPEWHELSVLLQQSSDNPYALALAAKALVSQDRCAEAEDFAARGFQRGRTYAAFEMTVIVDALGCRGVSDGLRRFWADRIDHVARSQERPAPLLENYVLLGRLALGQRDEARRLLDRPFQVRGRAGTGRLRTLVMRALDGKDARDDAVALDGEMRKLLFNPHTRATIGRTLYGPRPG